ncbi:S1 RNA binding domain protein [Hydrogenoanaerobacterium saccharovorans]|uniref:S1 RNA binding domain protein n=1 Tax=Hydrogenoanaerobacterium saccharovorans TaxID=474960 RepID=A0A1H7ZVU3_9FIRM|nr:S1 RNA-binding domain-containing protein [Hydrogenoanaerobacterium saccharovorans]RPF48343.1 S1 RNA binding domain protein [Hydrogenoanaerobacterium saccharovorans]SEM62565.1 S1 RNA binding domain protein [Hydrogenoanaerobacterium saccharovorans]
MQLEVGKIVEGKVTGITKFGAFVELPGGKTGMVHISEVATTYVNEISDYIKENQMVKVKVLSISPEGKVSLSIKRALPPTAPPPRRDGPRVDSFDWSSNRKNENMSFEDMMNKFKQTSDDKMSDLKKYSDVKRGTGNGGRRGGQR